MNGKIVVSVKTNLNNMGRLDKWDLYLKTLLLAKGKICNKYLELFTQ